jgi:hypothetical protein
MGERHRIGAPQLQQWSGEILEPPDQLAARAPFVKS